MADHLDKIDKQIFTIDKFSHEFDSLSADKEKLIKETYMDLCEYLKIKLIEGEDPEEKIDSEKVRLKEMIGNIKKEISKLDVTKEEWKGKLFTKKDELKKLDELRDAPDVAADVQSRIAFKTFSNLLHASYKTDQDDKAVAIIFKSGNRQIRFDDTSKTKQQKMNEFWKLLEYIDNKNL